MRGKGRRVPVPRPVGRKVAVQAAGGSGEPQPTGRSAGRLGSRGPAAPTARDGHLRARSLRPHGRKSGCGTAVPGRNGQVAPASGRRGTEAHLDRGQCRWRAAAGPPGCVSRVGPSGGSAPRGSPDGGNSDPPADARGHEGGGRRRDPDASPGSKLSRVPRGRGARRAAPSARRVFGPDRGACALP